MATLARFFLPPSKVQAGGNQEEEVSACLEDLSVARSDMIDDLDLSAGACWSGAVAEEKGALKKKKKVGSDAL